MRRALPAFLLLLAFTAIPLDAQQWTARRVLRLGEEEGHSFGRINGIAATPAEFFVLDAMESRVHVFNQAGKQLRTFGKRGSGPGELSNMPTHLVLWSNRLVITDVMNRRVNLFGLDGAFVDSRPLEPLAGFPMYWAPLAERVVYMEQPLPMAMPGRKTEDSYTLYAIKSPWDAPAQKLAEIGRKPSTDVAMSGSTVKMKMDMRTPVPFVASDGRQRILVATSDTYRISILNADGKAMGALSRPIARRKLTSAEIARLRKATDSTMTAGFAKGAASFGQSGGSMPKPEVDLILPEYLPIIAAMLAGDRFVLVNRPTSATGSENQATNWDVLGYDNRFLGTLRLPPRFRPNIMLGDRVYGVEQDDLDVESVAIYQLTGPGKR